MPNNVVSGAAIACSFGAAPSTLNVLPTGLTNAEGRPAATIMDAAPIVNIPPFGMCSSPSNPTVIAATAAALGVFTPMPCIPVTTAWVPGSPTTMIAKKPALTAGSTCICAWAGVIQITVPGAVRTMTN
jgi:hypothetical protein